jgi:hypothetical protein
MSSRPLAKPRHLSQHNHLNLNLEGIELSDKNVAKDFGGQGHLSTLSIVPKAPVQHIRSLQQARAATMSSSTQRVEDDEWKRFRIQLALRKIAMPNFQVYERSYRLKAKRQNNGIRYRAMIAEPGPWTTTTARFVTRDNKSYRTKAEARRALAGLVAWWMEHILAEFEDKHVKNRCPFNYAKRSIMHLDSEDRFIGLQGYTGDVKTPGDDFKGVAAIVKGFDLTHPVFARVYGQEVEF